MWTHVHSTTAMMRMVILFVVMKNSVPMTKKTMLIVIAYAEMLTVAHTAQVVIAIVTYFVMMSIAV